jgi:uncharacterized protein YjiS (DUF1127 family)
MSFATPDGGALSPTETKRAIQQMVLAAAWTTLMAVPLKLFAWWMERRRIAHTTATLAALSDRTLADIGLSRGDIPRIARETSNTYPV